MKTKPGKKPRKLRPIDRSPKTAVDKKLEELILRDRKAASLIKPGA